MRPIVVAILAVVAIILTWVLAQGSYKDSSVYILSLISTGLCGYLIADGFFNNAKKKWHIQRESHSHEVMQLNNDLDILKTQIKGMPPHSEIEALHNNFATVVADNDKLKSEIATHAIVIQQKNTDFAGLRSSHNQLLGENNKIHGALAEKDALIQKNQDTFHQLGIVIDGLHAEHDKIQGDIAAKDATIQKDQETFHQLETVVAALHVEHDKMQVDIAGKDATIQKNLAAFHQLETLIAAMDEEHGKLENTLISQDAVQQKLHSDLSATNTTLNEYRTAIKELHGIIADREKEETQLKADLAARENEIATLKNELATKDAVVIQHQNTVIALNDAVDKMNHDHEANEVQRQGELSQVRKTLEETRGKLVSIADENQKLRITPPVISKTTRDIIEQQPEDTKFLSEDKSIGVVRSHRTRDIDEDDSDAIKTIPATHSELVTDTVVMAKPVEAPTPVIVVSAPEPTPVPEVVIAPTPVIIITPVAPLVNEAVKIIPSDDLKTIEGIGPKIEQVLNAVGITTWHELAHTDPEKLREILSEAGKRFNANDPATWPEQARLLANGEMDKFKAYTDFLISGRVPKA